MTLQLLSPTGGTLTRVAAPVRASLNGAWRRLRRRIRAELPFRRAPERVQRPLRGSARIGDIAQEDRTRESGIEESEYEIVHSFFLLL
jgi:hypothetical protein